MITVADYEQAERDLTLYEEKLGWRIHVAVYCVVMCGLIAVNVGLAAHTGFDFPWSLFVLVGWGTALAGHHRHATRGSTRRLERQELIPRDGGPAGTGRRVDRTAWH